MFATLRSHRRTYESEIIEISNGFWRELYSCKQRRVSSFRLASSSFCNKSFALGEGGVSNWKWKIELSTFNSISTNEILINSCTVSHSYSKSYVENFNNFCLIQLSLNKSEKKRKRKNISYGTKKFGII